MNLIQIEEMIAFGEQALQTLVNLINTLRSHQATLNTSQQTASEVTSPPTEASAVPANFQPEATPAEGAQG